MSDDDLDNVTPLADARRKRHSRGRGGERADALDLTEDGLAHAFTALHGTRASFDHELGCWAYWCEGEGRWRFDRVGLVTHWARELCREKVEGEKESLQSKLRRRSTVGAVESFARCDPQHAVTSDIWDAAPMLLGVPGGVVDLRDGTMREPRPEDRITRQAAVAPDFAASCSRWHQFLDEATGGDEDLIAFLQVWVGYCLTGSTREHKLVFLYGEGENGKSVFLNTVRELIGDYAQQASMNTFLASRHESHSTDLAALRGARLVAVSEVGEGGSWDEAKIKTLTGGDKVRARFMRQDEFEFQPQFKLFIVGNHKPQLRNVDPAMKRRLRFLPFTQKPARPDPNLEDALRDEFPGILAWAVRGSAEWENEGLPEPRAVQEATAEYFDQQDVFGEWIEAECRIGGTSEHDWERSADLYAAWCEFAQKARHRPGNRSAFAERLRILGVERSRERMEGKAARIYRGIMLRRDP